VTGKGVWFSAIYPIINSGWQMTISSDPQGHYPQGSDPYGYFPQGQ